MASSPDLTTTGVSVASFSLWPLPDLRDATGDRYTDSDLEHREQDAFARGVAEGRREAQAAAQRRLGHLQESLTQAIDALREIQTRHQHSLEENLHVLALAIAREIVRREVEADPAVMAELVRRAIEHAGPDRSSVQVRLHPDDLHAVSQAGMTDVDAPVSWIGDEALERGELVVETPQRIVDGRFEPLLHSIYERLQHG